MTFGHQPVRMLAKTTIVLWNAGTEALRGEDIVEKDRVRFSIADGRVLNHRVVQTTTPATEVRLEVGEASNELAFRYNYLNPNDGAVVEILHDGTKVTIAGTSKALKDGPENWGTMLLARTPKRTWFLVRALPLLIVITGVAAAWDNY